VIEIEKALSVANTPRQRDWSLASDFLNADLGSEEGALLAGFQLALLEYRLDPLDDPPPRGF
jgi:hypothetical protein